MELKTFHPNLPQNTALNNSKTTSPEQSTNEQKKIPKSENSVCCLKFSAFLDHRVWAFSRTASKHTHSSSACTHRCRRRHTEHTPTKQLSVIQLSSEQAAAQPNLKNLLVSPILKGAWGAEFETTLEHMSYWSDQSKQCCRNTNTFYLYQRGGRWSRDDNWVILAFVCRGKPLLR